jgi:hypothetical protein
MARRDHAAELARHAAGERFDIRPTLRTLPASIDPALVVPIVLQMIERPYALRNTCRRLPAAVIRGVLAARCEHPNHLFLRLVVDGDAADDELVAEWQRAVQALGDLDLTYAWGSKPRRDRIRKVASDPVLLEAVQGTVAHSQSPSLDMLAVLVADGSRESIDALVPHVDPAFVAEDARLDRLRRLRTHATHTPDLDALFGEIDRAVSERNARSPALALGPVIGLGHVDPLWFAARIGSREQTPGNVSRVQGLIAIDSRQARWFAVSVSTGNVPDLAHTSFTADALHVDGNGLGRCAPTELPVWLAHVGQRLGATLEIPVIRSGVRGTKREAIRRWLLGG